MKEGKSGSEVAKQLGVSRHPEAPGLAARPHDQNLMHPLGHIDCHQKTLCGSRELGHRRNASLRDMGISPRMPLMTMTLLLCLDMYYGSEFVSKALDRRAYEHGVTLNILGLLVMALCFAAGTLFGPGQALSDQWGTCSGGSWNIHKPGQYGIKLDRHLKIIRTSQVSYHSFFITTAAR